MPGDPAVGTVARPETRSLQQRGHLLGRLVLSFVRWVYKREAGGARWARATLSSLVDNGVGCAVFDGNANLITQINICLSIISRPPPDRERVLLTRHSDPHRGHRRTRNVACSQLPTSVCGARQGHSTPRCSRATAAGTRRTVLLLLASQDNHNPVNTALSLSSRISRRYIH